MGYDMHWVTKPEGEELAVQAARDQFWAAVEERDALPKGDPARVDAQARVTAASEEMGRLERSYFRLNIWGMSRYVTAMDQLGVLCSGYSESGRPPWPANRPEGYYEWDEGELEVDEATATEFRVIRQQLVECRSWSPDLPGIPVHKFGSNDGWIVTPDECRFGAESIRSSAPDVVAKALTDSGITDTAYWNDWVRYLADAAGHGGFEVW